MADTTVTDINTIARTGNNSTSQYARSLTVASDGTAVGTADTAVIPAYNPKTDTIILCVTNSSTITISARSNGAGRTNDMAWSAVATVSYTIVPGALPGDVFIQDNGSLRLGVSVGTIYVTVLRCVA